MNIIDHILVDKVSYSWPVVHATVLICQLASQHGDITADSYTAHYVPITAYGETGVLQ